MVLSGKSIVDTYITNVKNKEVQVQQVGVDLTVKSIKILPKYIDYNGIWNNTSYISSNKDVLPSTIELSNNGKVDKFKGWRLNSDRVYSIEFNEGCKLPNNVTGYLKQRSSLIRQGCLITSGQFDPGFETENIGGMLILTNDDIFIEQNSRVCQIILQKCEEVENLYNGQFQKKKR